MNATLAVTTRLWRSPNPCSLFDAEPLFEDQSRTFSASYQALPSPAQLRQRLPLRSALGRGK